MKRIFLTVLISQVCTLPAFALSREERRQAKEERGQREYEEGTRMHEFLRPFFEEHRKDLVPAADEYSENTSQTQLISDVSENMLLLVKDIVEAYSCQYGCIGIGGRRALLSVITSETGKIKSQFTAAASQLEVGKYHSVTGDLGKSVLYSEGSVTGTIVFAVALPFTGAYDLTLGRYKHRQKDPASQKILQETQSDLYSANYKKVKKYLSSKDIKVHECRED